MKKAYQLETLDYVLAAVAVVGALLSTGISLRNEWAGIVFSALAITGLSVSYRVSKFRSESEKGTLEGAWTTVVALVALFAFPILNNLLPNRGYPPELPQSSVLSWMVALGAFFAWRDSTLLFLFVPSIASFGLVGAYDTFQQSPIVFFIFLMAIAVLFARSHLRFNARRAERFGTETHLLGRYEWNSLAGPGWALGSALLVIVFSALGAPLIQQSVQGATANLRVDNEVLRNIRNEGRNLLNANRTGGENLRVGRGPYGQPSDTVIMYVVTDRPGTLRLRYYLNYDYEQWNALTTFAQPVEANQGKFEIPRRRAIQGEPAQYTIQFRAPFGTLLPIPAETTELTISRQVLFTNIDGSVSTQSGILPNEVISGKATIPTLREGDNESKIPANTRPQMAMIYSKVSTTARVQQKAKEIVAGAKNDLEAAQLLRSWVSQRITYNLQAPAVPSGKDASDYVLYESQEGYCDLFSTALAEMARAAGLVSRVATGYLIDPMDRTKDGAFIIRDRHAHMWTEILFEGVGWVAFDATEGSREVPGAGRGSAFKDKRPFWEKLDWTNLGRILGVAGLVVAAVWLFGVGYRQFKRDGNLTGIVDPQRVTSGEAAVARSLTRIERSSGVPRRFEMTVREYLLHLASQRGVEISLATGLADLMDAALYGQDSENVAKIKQDARAFEALVAPRKQAA